MYEYIIVYNDVNKKIVITILSTKINIMYIYYIRKKMFIYKYKCIK